MARGLNVFVNIGAKVGSSLPGAVRTTERHFSSMARSARLAAAETKAAFRGMEGHFSRFNSGVAMPAAAMSGLGMRMAYEWSKVGNELKAVTGMSTTARKEIEAVARSMPGDPTKNLSAALDLARTGFTPTQIIGSLGTTIKLGMADSSVDQAEAADIMTNVMKGMNLPDGSVKDVAASSRRVANNIAFAAAKSSTDVRLMGESFKYAAPMASRLGMPIEELSGYFMTMADNGIKGSEAGVALRSGMVRMLKPTKGAVAVLGRYNMRLGDYVKASKKATADDVVKTLGAQGIDASGARGAIAALMANPNLSGAPLIAKISEAVAAGMSEGGDAADLDKISDGVMTAMTAGVTKLDMAKFIEDGVTKGWTASDFANFFDTRQGTRLMTLWGKDALRNVKSVEAAVRGLSGKGSFLDRMYATQMDGAVGPWENLKRGFGNVIISMAESGAMDTIANAMNAVANGMMSLSKTNPGLLKFITLGTLAIGVLAPLSFALGGIASGFRILWFALSGGAGLALRILGPLLNLAPMVMTVLTGLGGWIIRGLFAAFALLSNPVGWAIILAGVAAALVYYFRDDLAKAWTAVFEWFKNAWDGIKDWALSVDWKGIGMRIADALTFGLASKFAPILESAVKSAGDLVGAVKGSGGSGSGRRRVRGKRENGGPVSAGGAYLVGEAGPEIVTFGANGYVHANGTGSGGGLSVTINVNGAHDPTATAREVRRELERLANAQGALLSD